MNSGIYIEEGSLPKSPFNIQKPIKTYGEVHGIVEEDVESLSGLSQDDEWKEVQNY